MVASFSLFFLAVSTLSLATARTIYEDSGASGYAERISTTPSVKALYQRQDEGLQLGGFATYFFQNGAVGACGDRHGDDELIGAIAFERYGDLGQKSELCGKKVALTNLNNGWSITIVIADVCPTCENINSMDLSVSAFKAIADLGNGHIPSMSFNFDPTIWRFSN
ncbi:hypothetical protein PM082_010019 [Marasmius tenuissimus]|nr:hypothetical protein PM082_010019 [Marasmius tenuissimus]